MAINVNVEKRFIQVSKLDGWFLRGLSSPGDRPARRVRLATFADGALAAKPPSSCSFSMSGTLVYDGSASIQFILMIRYVHTVIFADLW